MVTLSWVISFVATLVVCYGATHLNLEEVGDDDGYVHYETGNYSDIDDELIFEDNQSFLGELITFENSKFTKIPRNFFDVFPNVLSVELKNCGIKRINRVDFLNGENLKRLNLRQNEIRSLPDQVFVRLINLEYLDIEDNNISDLDSNCFDGLENLKYLDVSDNVIKVLPEGIFQPLVNLQHLDIENCLLATIPDGVFANNVKLENVSLSTNRIRKIGNSVFTHLHNLNSVAVDNNLIDELYLPSVENLFVYETPLERCYVRGPIRNFFAMNSQLKTLELEDVTILEKVFVQGNHLTNVTNLKDASNLIDLDISYNPIDTSTLTLEMFANMKKLEFLDLSGLNITEFRDTRIFSSLENLTVLYMTNNNFVKLDYNLFTPMKSLVKLVISENQFLTDFNLQALRNSGFKGDVYGWK